MNRRNIWARRPLSVLGKLTVAALLVTALGYASELLSLGLDPEVSIVVAVLALVAGLVATGWPLAPVLGALVAGACFQSRARIPEAGGKPFAMVVGPVTDARALLRA
jgi:uncharacterized membrane protein YjjP (DUF1212 family)